MSISGEVREPDTGADASMVRRCLDLEPELASPLWVRGPLCTRSKTELQRYPASRASTICFEFCCAAGGEGRSSPPNLPGACRLRSELRDVGSGCGRARRLLLLQLVFRRLHSQQRPPQWPPGPVLPAVVLSSSAPEAVSSFYRSPICHSFESSEDC